MVLALFLTVFFTSIVSNYTFGTNFGAAGDWGCNSNTGKTVSLIKGKSPSYVAALGDYSYVNTATCWLNYISSIKSKTKIAIGNHEDDDSEGFSQYKSAFSLGNTYYTFTYDHVRFIVMDSDRVSYSVGSSQYNFVINELKKASTDSNVNWIIVYIHKEMYTSPNTCGAGNCANDNSEIRNLRNIYHKYFDQYGVSMVLNGHVHNYQRTFPIKYDSGSPDSPIKTSSNAFEWTDPTGEIFATVGTGGVNFHALSGKASFVAKQQDDKFGALVISTEDSGNTLAGRYYTNDGSKFDTFKIHKYNYAVTSQYSYGPSLTLSGEAPTSTLQSDKGSIGLSGGDLQPTQGQDNNNQGQDNNNQGQDNNNQGQDNNNQPEQNNGQGKGLDCEHFKQQGPTRCRIN